MQYLTIYFILLGLQILMQTVSIILIIIQNLTFMQILNEMGIDKHPNYEKGGTH